ASCSVRLSYATHTFAPSVLVPCSSSSLSLPLHDALPIWILAFSRDEVKQFGSTVYPMLDHIARQAAAYYGSQYQIIYAIIGGGLDRKRTRLNSSHVSISYAVSCLKKRRTCRDEHPTA